MRIAILSESYEPVQNGVSTSVRTLADELRGKLHHVCVIAPQHPENEQGTFVIRVPSWLSPLNEDYPLPYPVFPKLRLEFNKMDIDVIHTQSPWFLGLLGARLAKQSKIPLVSTYHTLYNHYGHYLFFLPKPAVESMLQWWLPDYYNKCTHIIVPSQVAAESLKSAGVQRPMSIIPTGAPLPDTICFTSRSKKAIRARFGIPATAKLLLYAGRLAQEKNIELVLSAFSRVAMEHENVWLLIVGGGPHEPQCRHLASRMRSGNRIVFAGPMSRHELDPIFASADIFVFGSSTETQGLVIAEARAAGTPSVVVNGGGAPENVKHGEDGFVVPPEADVFAKHINMLLQDNKLLKTMSEACKRNAVHFTPDNMANQVLEVYRNVIEMNRAISSNKSKVSRRSRLKDNYGID
ncbi:MAG: glycosyltransferase [Chthonomonadales bacterium]